MKAIVKKETLDELKTKAQSFLNASKSDATKRAYRSDWQTFSRWADSQNLDFLPASSTTVALYITHLADIGRAISTISRAMTAISQAHKTMRIPTPTRGVEVGEVYRGIRRTVGTAKRQAKPLVLSELKLVIKKCGLSFLAHRDSALILLGWAGALRRSEIVDLNVDDIDFVEEGLTITIRHSKTDQESEGYLIGIPFGKNEKLCPVISLKQWIELANIKEGPVFFSIGTPGKQMFYVSVGQRRHLSARSVNLILKRRLEQAGLSSKNYSGHSLRAGFITSAAQKETPEGMIQIHTRHRSTAVLRGYIRRGNVFESNPLSVLL